MNAEAGSDVTMTTPDVTDGGGVTEESMET